MIIVNLPCEGCIHYTGLTEQKRMSCKAFPSGIEFNVFEEDVTQKEECNNGYKYEPIENQEEN